MVRLVTADVRQVEGVMYIMVDAIFDLSLIDHLNEQARLGFGSFHIIANTGCLYSTGVYVLSTIQ